MRELHFCSTVSNINKYKYFPHKGCANFRWDHVLKVLSKDLEMSEIESSVWDKMHGEKEIKYLERQRALSVQKRVPNLPIDDVVLSPVLCSNWQK